MSENYGKDISFWLMVFAAYITNRQLDYTEREGYHLQEAALPVGGMGNYLYTRDEIAEVVKPKLFDSRDVMYDYLTLDLSTFVYYQNSNLDMFQTDFYTSTYKESGVAWYDQVIGTFQQSEFAINPNTNGKVSTSIYNLGPCCMLDGKMMQEEDPLNNLVPAFKLFLPYFIMEMFNLRIKALESTESDP